MMRTIHTSLLLAALAGCGAASPGAPGDVPAVDTGADTGADRPAPLCTPGRTKACPCASGVTGAQTCQPDGTYSACACFDAGAPTEDVVTRDAELDAPADDVADVAADASRDVVGDGPVRGTYARCAADDRCAAGACLVSSLQPPGMTAARHCSALCGSGSALGCPGYVRGQVECIAPEGSVMFAQCFRLCQSTNDCAPFNTTCMEIRQPAGPIRVCVPTG